MSIFQLALAYDFDRPEVEILCDLIFAANQYSLKPSVVTFGDPKELDTRPEIEDDANSYIPAQVDPTFDSRLKNGETGFMYTRLPLAALPPIANTTITAPSFPFKAHSILAQINAQLGIRLTENDIENTEYLGLDDDFIIYAKATSKLWIGSRWLQVLGGGRKDVLFPNNRLYGFMSAASITGAPKPLLAALANHDNGTTWIHNTDFEFKHLEKVPVGGVGRNTRILVKAKRFGYIDQWLYYARIDPNTINKKFTNGVVPTVSIPDEDFSLHSILGIINSTLGLNLTADDVFDQEFEAGVPSISFFFKPTSVAWLPGSYSVKLRYENPQQLRMIGDGDYRVSGDGIPRTT